MRSLSGRLLILTIGFVMLAEILIFVPSVARFRVEYLDARLERAQIASLALLASDEIDPTLERELLQNAGVFNVVLVRDQVRELALSSPIETPIIATYDLRQAGPAELIRDAFGTLLRPQAGVIRVIGQPVQDGGRLIEVTMQAGPLRDAMLDYGLRILALSAVISGVTAALLFAVARRFVVRPIEGVVRAMESYRAAPEDHRRIITPSASVAELRQAETALQALQTQLTAALRQKDRLAQLGAAVAKISHDLRNVLTTTQLFADRLETSQDPTVARLAPKLTGSISRAIAICEGTLAFGRADEPSPVLARIPLAPLAEDVLAGERMAAENGVTLGARIAPDLQVRADPEQLFRILSNLVRNARQALDGSGSGGGILIEADETPSAWVIRVRDTGPGLPRHARENLFKPFQGATRKGGSGLGLSIAQELARGHGGTLTLNETSASGTTFELVLPKSVVELDAAE